MSIGAVSSVLEVALLPFSPLANLQEAHGSHGPFGPSRKTTLAKPLRQRCPLCSNLSAPRPEKYCAAKRSKRRVVVCAAESGAEKTAIPEAWTDPWLDRLPPDNSPLYSHSLLCIEAWLRSLGFAQQLEDPANWTIKREDWHAELRLDVVDLSVKFLKSGPGKLPRDIEKRWSYGLSRRDLQAAIMGGP